jgi:hypothetical protein
MTDKEIKRALECCIDNQHCWLCVLRDRENDCYELEKSALDLIKRQQAEIERLTINMNAFGLGMKQEKERADTIRAEAIKEFAEKLADVFYSHDKGDTYVREVVYNLVKEMVGEDKC